VTQRDESQRILKLESVLRLQNGALRAHLSQMIATHSHDSALRATTFWLDAYSQAVSAAFAAAHPPWFILESGATTPPAGPARFFHLA